eukprot:Clim_evm54s148 gene=Clim_evmTU54s148
MEGLKRMSALGGRIPLRIAQGQHVTLRMASTFNSKAQKTRSLTIGLVGMPNVGKSSMFNMLTKAQIAAENYPFCTIDPNEGIALVDDPNLKTIADHIRTKKITPQTFRITDIAGLVRGASEGKGLGNHFLAHIRGVSAIMHMVRCFPGVDLVSHVDNRIDPIADVEGIESELTMADMEFIDSVQRTIKRDDHDSLALLKAARKCIETVSVDGNPTSLRSEFDPESEEGQILRQWGFLSAKPVFYVANVSEDQLSQICHGTGPSDDAAKVFLKHCEAKGEKVVPAAVSAMLELNTTSEKERAEMLEMMEDLGIQNHLEPLPVLKQALTTLGLHTFYTAGEAEVRAWPVRIGATAQQAANVIHTEIAKSLIKTEVYTIEDLIQYKAEDKIRKLGKLRQEGKDYVLQSTDIVRFVSTAK